MTASEKTLENVSAAMDALEIIGNRLCVLKDEAEHDAGTWPCAGDSGKIANDLAALSEFCK